MRRLYMVALLLGCVVPVPAHAESVVDAKVHCQMDYGSGSDTDVACERGVDLASRAPDKLQDALATCHRDTEDPTRAAACQRGVELHTSATKKTRGDTKTSNFSYSWKEGSSGSVGVTIGNYQATLGDAEKSMEECMRAYEGSSTPPSCLSGIKIQRKAPAAPPMGHQP